MYIYGKTSAIEYVYYHCGVLVTSPVQPTGECLNVISEINAPERNLFEN